MGGGRNSYLKRMHSHFPLLSEKGSQQSVPWLKIWVLEIWVLCLNQATLWSMLTCLLSDHVWVLILIIQVNCKKMFGLLEPPGGGSYTKKKIKTLAGSRRWRGGGDFN